MLYGLAKRGFVLDRFFSFALRLDADPYSRRKDHSAALWPAPSRLWGFGSVTQRGFLSGPWTSTIPWLVGTIRDEGLRAFLLVAWHISDYSGSVTQRGFLSGLTVFLVFVFGFCCFRFI